MKVKIYKLLLALLEKMYYNNMCNRALFTHCPSNAKGVFTHGCVADLLSGMKLP